MTEVSQRPEDDAHKDRRKFLASCGKFALVTPPAITMLLSTSLHSSAIAHSGGRAEPDLAEATALTKAMDGAATRAAVAQAGAVAKAGAATRVPEYYH